MTPKSKGFWNFLEFGLGRRQFTGHYGIGKTYPVMAAVAEGLVGGVAASAKRDHGPSGQAETRPGGIADLELAFDSYGTVVIAGDLGGHLLEDSRAGQLPAPPAGLFER